MLKYCRETPGSGFAPEAYCTISSGCASIHHCGGTIVSKQKKTRASGSTLRTERRIRSAAAKSIEPSFRQTHRVVMPTP